MYVSDIKNSYWKNILINHLHVECEKLGQYHGCWCPGSLGRQDISSHDIDNVE